MNLILANKTFYLIKSRRTASPCDPDQGDDDHPCVYHNREIVINDVNLASCLNYNRHLHSEIDYSASSIHENDTLTCCKGTIHIRRPHWEGGQGGTQKEDEIREVVRIL